MSESVEKKGDNSGLLSTRVRLIVAFFGSLPAWFPIWLRSCGANPSFEWLVFTDAQTDFADAPRNVSFAKISFPEVCELITSRLGMPVCLPNPYKLCDFKIAYGVIFADWLRGYDFWGHCDLDVVWGSLGSFFNDELFAACDRIQESGHLTFMRNSEAVNTLYQQDAPHVNYREVFTNPRAFAFDEWGGGHDLAYLRRLKRKWIKNFWDIDPLTFRLTDPIQENFRRQLFYWQDGHLYREYVEPGSRLGSYEYPITVREEASYIHLQQRDLPAPAFDVQQVRGFYVTPRGFVQKVKDEHCLEDFIRMNPQSWTYRPVGRLKRAVRAAKLRALDWFR